MKFSIPKPPSVNHLYGHRGWRKYLTRKGVEWFEEAGWHIRDQITIGSPLRHCTLKIDAFIIKGDIDNLLKATQDLLTKIGIIEDDKWIMEIHMTKHVVHHRKDEHLEVEIVVYEDKS